MANQMDGARTSHVSRSKYAGFTTSFHGSKHLVRTVGYLKCFFFVVVVWCCCFLFSFFQFKCEIFVKNLSIPLYFVYL